MPSAVARVSIVLLWLLLLVLLLVVVVVVVFSFYVVIASVGGVSLLLLLLLLLSLLLLSRLALRGSLFTLSGSRHAVHGSRFAAHHGPSFAIGCSWLAVREHRGSLLSLRRIEGRSWQLGCSRDRDSTFRASIGSKCKDCVHATVSVTVMISLFWGHDSTKTLYWARSSRSWFCFSICCCCCRRKKWQSRQHQHWRWRREKGRCDYFLY